MGIRVIPKRIPKGKTMKKEFVILTDSGSDISKENAEKWGVELIPLMYSVNGCDPIPGDCVDIDAFYDEIRKGSKTSTSACNFADACDYLEKYAKDGLDILCLPFSSGLSSTYQNMKMAAEEISEKYPDVKIILVDCLAASLGLGLLCLYASRMRSEGKTIEEVRDFLEENKLHLCHNFTVNDLFYLQKGGRVSAAAAVVGSVLAVKPMLHVDNEGHLVSTGKARGRKASISELVTTMEKNCIEPENQTVIIVHSDCRDDADALAGMIREKLNPKEILIDCIGPVIGCHSGIGTLAVFYMGTER